MKIWNKNARARDLLLVLRQKWTMVTILGLCVLSLAVDHFGWLRAFESGSLDKVLRLRTPIQQDITRLVAIDEADYAERFGSQSPLEPFKVLDLIEAIAVGQPKLIAVDIDTAGKAWADPAIQGRLKLMPPIVWAENPKVEEDHVTGVSEALGGSHPAFTGAALFPVDWDGVSRRYYRYLEGTNHPVISFPWQIVTAALDLKARGDEVDEKIGRRLLKSATAERHGHSSAVLLNFADSISEFDPMTAGQVMAVSKTDGWTSNGPIKGKIVILGQEHRLTRDDRATPIGTLSGLRMIAQVVETELQGRGVTPLSWWVKFLFDLIVSILLVTIFHFLLGRAAVWISLALVPVLGLGGSFLIFGTIAHWPSFVLVFGGVLVHLLDHHLKHYQKLCRELEELKNSVDGGVSKGIFPEIP